MCGIAGIAAWGSARFSALEVERMTDAITHRGPDDSGVWIDQEIGVGLGQRRLSIIDLSPQGHQPMISATGRWVMVYNGEIYNFQELRKDLERSGMSPLWRGHSDTEVLLAYIEAHGFEVTLRRTVGMFAIALWDRRDHVLTLARDRLGEKPMYYGQVNGRLLFASELKAIKAVEGGGLEIEREALSQFFRFGYIPSPYSIWRGVRKLAPGHWIELRSAEDALLQPKPFWQLEGDEYKKISMELAHADDKTLIDLVEDRLSQSIRQQMIADVPLGAFLSGGIDSSVVVALMQRWSIRPVRTFTIGFDQPEINEAPFAKKVASHLGTEHTELYVTANDAKDLIPELPEIYDEPFADSSQIPTTLLARLTKQHVAVSLSGDGGDELFSGYPRYVLTEALWRRVNRIPLSLRRATSAAICTPSMAAWDCILSILPSINRNMINGRRIHLLSKLLSTRSIDEMYLRLMSQWQPEEQLVLGLELSKPSLINWDSALRPIEAMRRWDIGQYLPDDLLVKVDRASMSASLEVRTPMLDHRLVELAFSMPERALIRDGLGKWVLRQVLFRYVPTELVERPKAGFSIPLAAWLRGPLRGWAEELLEDTKITQAGLLDPILIKNMWREHISGQFDRSSNLWSVLMFQAWLKEQSM